MKKIELYICRMINFLGIIGIGTIYYFSTTSDKLFTGLLAMTAIIGMTIIYDLSYLIEVKK